VTDQLGRHRIMAHMIPWFPDQDSSLAIAKGLLEGGTAYLEIQFPFTDPSADGPVIEQACQKAISNGFKVTAGFAFVREVTDWIDQRFVGQMKPPIFIMSYASLVMARGVERFVADAKTAGVAGLIIPDLPPDNDEGLGQFGRQYNLSIVPVLVPFISTRRLAMILATRPTYIYCALRAGITGKKTTLGAEVLTFLSMAGSKGALVFGGFGITEPAQVAAIAGSVHATVVGSQIVRLIDKSVAAGANQQAIREAVQDFVETLVTAT
jgi:tryptophan synthase alpha chain